MGKDNEIVKVSDSKKYRAKLHREVLVYTGILCAAIVILCVLKQVGLASLLTIVIIVITIMSNSIDRKGKDGEYIVYTRKLKAEFERDSKIRVYRIDNVFINDNMGDFDETFSEKTKWKSENRDNFAINEENIRRKKDKNIFSGDTAVQNNVASRSMLSRVKKI